MYILGLTSFAHEATCALIKDGQLKFLIEEERLNREKHTWKYPANAIRECLKREGITINDVAHITFFWVPKKEIVDNLAHFLKYFPASLNLLAAKSGGNELKFLERVRLMSSIGRSIQQQFDLPHTPQVHFVEHHLCHAASAFFVSGFREAAILTADGRGESASTVMCVGRENHIEKIREIKVPHSLGHFYAAITEYLGFKPFFDEWKVMGMSAYGKDTFVKIFEDMILLNEDGGYHLNLKYFGFHTHGQARWVSDYLIEKLGPKRERTREYDQRHFDVAFGLQRVIEKTGVHLCRALHQTTKLSNLCLTGGVVLNCLMNKKIIESTPFKDVFIQPIANDAGAALGSALYHYHQNLKRPQSSVFEHVYHGPQFSDEDIENVLRAKGVHYYKSENVARDTARHIADEKIVGWFQGRMEAGPRALGNRSIVVSPLHAGMKDRLNARVKKREHFRPFAPSVQEERAKEFFRMPRDFKSPYMILVGEVLEEKRSVIPAVTHADGTARVHTVSKKVNPRYWELIDEFAKITGVPVIINTSFNENEPIVCTPKDAVECFLRTEFDVLAIGNFLVTKEG
ncbi:MAG: carbamoyltransferase [Candidatus Omnitrophica bacterium]|nr:carbamoyltransferase [Candidatus Omnitrophota bacterium]